MTLYVAPIVEGQTEQGCLERLLHRVWNELLLAPERLQILEPYRGHRDALVHPDGRALGDVVRKAFVKLQTKQQKDSQGRALLLLLLDAEGDCPAELAPRLLRTAQLARSDADVACVLAKRMFENWFVASAASLAGVNELPDPLLMPANPEDCGGASWLEQRLRSQNPARGYAKTLDSPLFVNAMDLRLCQANSPSFAKLRKELALRVPPPVGNPPDNPAPAAP